jgi:hypothetical protein
MTKGPVIGGTDNVGEIRSSVDPVPGAGMGVQTYAPEGVYDAGPPAGWPREHLWMWLDVFTPKARAEFWLASHGKTPDEVGKAVARLVQRHDDVWLPMRRAPEARP